MTASSTRHPLYCVVIRHNIVATVTIVQPRADIETHSDPLAVSTLVARRMQQHGCMDGDYHFAELSMARHFAGLAMDFMGRIAGKTAEALEKADIHPDGWLSPFVPARGAR